MADKTNKYPVILVAEDNKGLNLLITESMERMGLKAESCYSGEEVINRVVSDADVLILLDYALPDMTAKQIIEKLEERNLFIPFVIMTGHGDVKISVEMMKMGSRDYLIKDSVFLDLLPAVVDRVLEDILIEKKLESAEQSLLESEKQYRSVFMHSLDGIYIYDFNGNFIDANPAALQMIGYSESDIPELTFNKIMDEEEVLKVQDNIRTILENGDGGNLDEYRIRKKDGTYIWVETRATLVSKGGKPYLIQGNLREITGRKESEKKLKDNEEKFRTLIESSSEVISIFDVNGKLKYITPSSSKFLGYSPGDVSESDAANMLHPDDVRSVSKALKDAVAEKKNNIYLEYRAKHKDGTWRNIETTGNNLTDNPLINGIVLYTRDVTERKRYEQELSASRALFFASIEQSPVGILIINPNLDIIAINAAIPEIFRLDPLSGKPSCLMDIINLEKSSVLELYNIDESLSKIEDMPIVAAVRRGVKTKDIQFRIRNKIKNADIWVMASASPVLNEKNEIIAAIQIFVDITSSRVTSLALEKSQEKYKRLYNDAIAGMLTARISDGRILASNDRIIEIFGFPHARTGIRFLSEIDLFVDEADKMYFITAIQENRKIDNIEAQFRKRDGSLIWCEVSIRKYPDADRADIAVMDISNRKYAEQQVHNLTFYDQLTRLPNKEYLRKQLEEEIEKTTLGSGRKVFAVMCLAINQFKNINNIYGYSAGDTLLIQISKKITDNIYEKDMVSRFDGNKFMVLFSSIAGREDASELVKKISAIFEEPFNIDDLKLYVNVSIGMCLYPKDGETPELLIENSEAAMYMAKNKNVVIQYFDSQLNSEMLSRFQIEKELRSAVSNDEFVAFFQPKYTRDRKLAGMEALVRWMSPRRGLVPPMEFIPLTEENGMICEIGNLVLSKACMINKKWQQQGYKNLKVSVNLSPFQFSQENLISGIKNVLDATGLDPEWLELEITESGIMRNEKANLKKLSILHEMGLSISIDDFGTGYSSLSKLKDYPIDTLKIDRLFVKDLPADQKSATIATTIIDLGHNLGFRVVAEGVETEEQFHFLAALKCDQFQGFYFGKPIQADEFEMIIKNP